VCLLMLSIVEFTTKIASDARNQRSVHSHSFCGIAHAHQVRNMPQKSSDWTESLLCNGNHLILGQVLGKMPKHRDEIKPKLGMTDHIIAQFVFHPYWIPHTRWSAKTMHPTEPGQAETSSACLPELFMYVAFLSTKSPKPRVKAEPGLFQATECPQPLHGDLERFPPGILPSWVTCPRSPHLLSPTRLEMGRDQLPIVVEQGALEQILTSRMLVVKLF